MQRISIKDGKKEENVSTSFIPNDNKVFIFDKTFFIYSFNILKTLTEIFITQTKEYFPNKTEISS